MNQSDPLSPFPQKIRASLEASSLTYVRLPDHYAIHGTVPTELLMAVRETLNNQSISILQGKMNVERQNRLSLTISPVYALEPHGVPAVPTGKLFIRLEEHIRAEEKRDILETMGYQIIDIPPYAPYTCWVSAHPDSLTTSLSHLSKLQTIADIRNIEPQMLTALRYRGIPKGSEEE